MASSLVSAVGTDTFGGLTGFKRPLSGNPTRVPTNLPAFRGVQNKPGANIRSPAIKSSANHPDRKTNVCIPYARQVPLDLTADVGRRSPGDVVFCSKARPGIPGYATSRFTRLCGIDALNKWMGPNHWPDKVEDGRFRNILIDPLDVTDQWRSVPILGEWAVDGVVLSNEESDQFYNRDTNKREGHLFNIAVQGPSSVNNGYVEEFESNGDLQRRQQGQIARHPHSMPVTYMDPPSVSDSKDPKRMYDFAADYRGPQYHLYPLQMFSRDIRPMQELYVGLVATEYAYDQPAFDVINEFDVKQQAVIQATAVQKTVEDSNTAKVKLGTALSIADTNASAAAATDLTLAQLDLASFSKYEELKQAGRAKSAYERMGWLLTNPTTGPNDGFLPSNGTPPPAHSFVAFRYALFTSGQAWTFLDDKSTMMTPIGTPAMPSKRMRLPDLEFHEDDRMRITDMRSMVGAWHIGKVLDMKAGKMPFMEGGPVETGYRVTVDVNIGWCDYRALRNKYSPVDSHNQFGDVHVARWTPTNTTGLPYPDPKKIFQWPTAYTPYRSPTGSPGEKIAAMESYSQVPTNPDKFHNGETPDLAERRDYLKRHLAEANAGTAVPRSRPVLINSSLTSSQPSMLPSVKRQAVQKLSSLTKHTAVAAPSAPSAIVAPPAAPAAAIAAPAAPIAAPAAPIAAPAAPIAGPSASTSGTGAPAPEAAVSGQPPRRRAAPGDVFSTIFGSGSGDAPQPLNPAHRDASGGGTGRSYQRRGKK